MEDDRLPDLPLVGSDRRWVVTKIVLRSIILILATAVAVMSAIVAVAVYPTTIITTYPYVSYAYLLRPQGSVATQMVKTLTPPVSRQVIPTIVWNCTEFLVMCLRRSTTKGITPKAHVGVELIMWMGGVVVLSIQCSYASWFYPEHQAYPPPYNFQSEWRFALIITSCCLTGLLA